jgi:hypothetical protein
MSLPERPEIRVRVSEDLKNTRHCSEKVGLTSSSERPYNRRDGSLPARLTFLEDFTAEHSNHVLRIEVLKLGAIF